MFRTTRFATVVAVAALAMSACSGGTEATIVAVDGTTTSSNSQEVATVPAVAAGPSEPTGTVTLEDGTVISINVSKCRTQATEPNALLNAGFFTVSGNSVDDVYHFSATRATTADAEEPAPQVVLKGDRDENRVNPKIEYINFGTAADGPSALVVDGARVSGEATLRDFASSNRVFGESVTVSVDFNCG